MYTQCWIVGAIIEYCTHLPVQETTRLYDIIIHEDSDCFFFFFVFFFQVPLNVDFVRCTVLRTSKIYTRRRISTETESNYGTSAALKIYI